MVADATGTSVVVIALSVVMSAVVAAVIGGVVPIVPDASAQSLRLARRPLAFDPLINRPLCQIAR